MLLLFRGLACSGPIAYTFVKGGFLFLVTASLGLLLLPASFLVRAVNTARRSFNHFRYASANQRPGPGEEKSFPAPDYTGYPYTSFPARLGL